MLEATWPMQISCRYLSTHILFGLDVAVWSMVVPVVVGWHAAFFVNSAAHIWGYQTYETGDLSTNNWWVAMLAGGEGWHNTHYAFPYSARHGLEWYEFDLTWSIICLLERLGLAWDLQVGQLLVAAGAEEGSARPPRLVSPPFAFPALRCAGPDASRRSCRLRSRRRPRPSSPQMSRWQRSSWQEESRAAAARRRTTSGARPEKRRVATAWQRAAVACTLWWWWWWWWEQQQQQQQQ
jgi:hypothetical protein